MIQVEANAKINLTLDILGKRPDGYHEVAMVMQSVALSDMVFLEEGNEGIVLSLDTNEVPADASNLAYKAARLFLDEQGLTRGVRIHIQKRIPVAAGLAGGSTDAAAVLRGMDALLGTELAAPELARMGAIIGSDVPFCLTGGTMLATGRGEVLRRLPDMPAGWVVLAKPPESISTAWAYRTYDERPAAVHPDNAAMIAALADGLEAVARSVGNVLEAATIPSHPIIDDYKRCLTDNGALAALMSGSGPTVFALADSEETARKAARALQAAYPDAAAFVVPAVNGPGGIRRKDS